MSNYEIHVGKLKKIDYKRLGFNTIEDWCKEMCMEEHITPKSYHKDYIEDWLYHDKNYNKYHIRNDKLYKIIDKMYEDRDLCEMKLNNDGEFEYVFSFDNGGTCLSEMIDEKLNDFDKLEERFITVIFYETDGYTDKKIDTIRLPKCYIENDSDKYNIRVNKEGSEFIKSFYHPGFDNGGYYRLRLLEV